jgi:hypothetical protein
MKRITLLVVLAVALLMAVGIPVMAATTFAWSGEITYDYMTDFTNAKDYMGNYYLNLAASPADGFTGYMGIYFNPEGITQAVTTISGGAVTASLANILTNTGSLYFTADLGKVLKLPVGEVATIGWIDTAATGYSVSGFGYEALAVDGLGVRDNVQLVTTFSGINLQVSVSPDTLFAPISNPLYLVDVYGSMAPVSFSLAYTSNANKLGGVVFGDVQFAQAFGDIGVAADAEATYDLAAAAYKIGIGARMTYTTMLTVAVGTNLNAAGLGNLGLNVNFVASPTMGADLGVSIPGTFASINCIDASVWTKLGVSTLRLGYDYTTSTIGYELAVLAKGGLYLIWDLTF